MAGWMWAFKAIPWGDVIAAAPTVAKNAKKLWGTMRSPAGSNVPAADSPQERIRALEAQVAELGREQAASAEVLRSLAEQNERLVAAVEILRERSRITLVTCALLALVLLGLTVWLITR